MFSIQARESICPSIHPSISVCVSVHLFVCPSVCVSVNYLPITFLFVLNFKEGNRQALFDPALCKNVRNIFPCPGDFRLTLEETKRLQSLHSGGRYICNTESVYLSLSFYITSNFAFVYIPFVLYSYLYIIIVC